MQSADLLLQRLNLRPGILKGLLQLCNLRLFFDQVVLPQRQVRLPHQQLGLGVVIGENTVANIAAGGQQQDREHRHNACEPVVRPCLPRCSSLLRRSLFLFRRQMPGGLLRLPGRSAGTVAAK